QPAEPSGYSVIASSDLPSDTAVVSIPFSLAITPTVSRAALETLFEASAAKLALDGWSERQLICSYICMHWVVERNTCGQPAVLAHHPYLATLPSPDKLLTPLHFIPVELAAFQGTNLYGATLARRDAWRAEWQACQSAIAQTNPDWADTFTWDRYLTASTYLSSRAFPSTLLSPTPSLAPSPDSHPVLLPGVDALNHARGQPVSWAVSTAPNAPSSISLVLHNAHPAGAELFNNYGPKPNAELILGYGFALPHNPDDTIVLKLGGAPAAQHAPQNSAVVGWEVGRDARGAEPVWEAVLAAVCESDTEDEDRTVEDELCAADALEEMAQNLYERLPKGPPEGALTDSATLVQREALHWVRWNSDANMSVNVVRMKLSHVKHIWLLPNHRI
ncbi:hypothetical protein POSPLADRAFT_1159712, partial [Postia placenta MAD-698-R-SB12]